MTQNPQKHLTYIKYTCQPIATCIATNMTDKVYK